MPTSKPTNIDAQRIIEILNELKEKLTFLSMVSSQVLEGLQSEEGQATCELLGQDLVNTIANQIWLEENYLRDNAAGEGAFGNQEEGEELREDVKLLHKNTLELCRKMKAVPNIVQSLREFQETRSSSVMQFLRTLADMQDLTYKRLTTTVEEERSRQELLEYYKSREKEGSNRQQQLEQDLAHIRRESERAQSQRSEVLMKLKADSYEVKESKQDQMNVLRTRYITRMKDHQEVFDAKKEDLIKKINALKASKEAMRKKNEEEETKGKRGARKFDKEVKDVIQTYDQQIKEIYFTINDVTDNFKKEQKQLDELREHFAKVDAEKEFISNEEMITEARRQKLEMAKQRKNDASALVQAFWRAILERERYQQMKKKKKGGGKKGKRK